MRQTLIGIPSRQMVEGASLNCTITFAHDGPYSFSKHFAYHSILLATQTRNITELLLWTLTKWNPLTALSKIVWINQDLLSSSKARWLVETVFYLHVYVVTSFKCYKIYSFQYPGNHMKYCTVSFPYYIFWYAFHLQNLNKFPLDKHFKHFIVFAILRNDLHYNGTPFERSTGYWQIWWFATLTYLPFLYFAISFHFDSFFCTMMLISR